jgi:hypothetical protein
MHHYIYAFLLFCLIGLAPSVRAAEDENSFAKSPELIRFPIVLARNFTVNLCAQQNLVPLLIGAVSSLAISPADQEISRSVANHAHEFGKIGDVLGGRIPVSVVEGSLLASLFIKDDHFRSFSFTIAQAYVMNDVLTRSIKASVNRMRPDRSDSYSFLSGHTSSSFMMATVVNKYYGKKWGIPAYAFAALVGISRIEKNKHWPSDVISGAALGYISGRSAIIGTERELSRKRENTSFRIEPFYGRDSKGISVSFIY